nr:basic leucine zipper transcriptional factor ATF-like 3 isoform X2 [Oryctolagus cuniculus]
MARGSRRALRPRLGGLRVLREWKGPQGADVHCGRALPAHPGTWGPRCPRAVGPGAAEGHHPAAGVSGGALQPKGAARPQPLPTPTLLWRLLEWGTRALRMMTGRCEGEKKTELLLREVGRSRPRRLTNSTRLSSDRQPRGNQDHFQSFCFLSLLREKTRTPISANLLTGPLYEKKLEIQDCLNPVPKHWCSPHLSEAH